LLLMVLAPVLRVVAAAPLDGASTAKRMEVRVETLANLESGSVESCEAIQTKSASAALSFAFWSTLGEAGSAASESSGKAGMSLRCTGRHCGGGAFPGAASTPTGAPLAPFLIHEVSADVGWDSGIMDPGPVGAAQMFLTLTSRRLTGFSPEGVPLYGAPVT